MSKTATKSPSYEFDLELHISIRAAEVFDEILDQLGVDGIREGRYRWVGTCPVHEGDKSNAFQLYIGKHEGDIPNWKCRTRHCESILDEHGKPKWGNSLIGVVRAVLSKKAKKLISREETCKWLCEFLGIKIDEQTNLKIDYDKMRLTRIVNQLRPQPQSDLKTYPLNVVDRLKIPSEYYLRRGYSEEVLRKHCVGDCINNHPQNRMQHRAVVPIYDQDRQVVVGFTGRSVFNRCDKCRLWHDQNQFCPKTGWEIMLGQKWLVSKDFTDKDYLYNYWFAKEHIQQDNTAIIVEGPGDVWRLEEAGFYNGVAIFGINLTPSQMLALESCGTLNLIILSDADDAGSDCSNNLKKQCERLFNLTIPDLECKDIGETPVDTVRSILKPILEKT